MNTPHSLSRPDADLMARFQRQDIGRDEWSHAMHVRVAWIHLRLWPFETALDRMRSGIRTLNAANHVANDESGGYHETISRAWLHLIAGHGDEASDSAAFLYEQHDWVAHKRTLLRHYSKEALGSTRARTEWVEPDIAPLHHERSKYPL